MFLADGASPVMSFVLLGVLLLIIILSPIMMKARNKKETERMQNMIDSLKKGDKILTTSLVYGKVIGIEEKDGLKLITLETGNEKNKSYITIDAGAIYVNLSSNLENSQAKVDEKTDIKQEPKQEPKEDVIQEQNVEVNNVETEKIKENKNNKSKKKNK